MMSHRIDLELTSARPDGTWTWRAAGARQPKGSLESSLLYEGAQVGDVVRADAELGLDGTSIVRLYPPRERRPEPQRLLLVASPNASPGVTSSLLTKSPRSPRAPGRGERDGWGSPGSDKRSGDKPGADKRSGDKRSGDKRSGDKRSGDRDDQRRRPVEAGRRADPGGTLGRKASQGAGEHDTGDEAKPDRIPPVRRAATTSGSTPPRSLSGAPLSPASAPRRESPGTRMAGEKSLRSRPGDSHAPRSRDPGDRSAAHHGSARLVPGSTHRTAALAALPAEQRPIAEQLLKGGLSAVRQAIDAQNLAAREAGRPEVSPEHLLTLAEQLVGGMKAAAWRDRAEAAVAAGDDLALRDLRSVVSGADSAARDDETRLLAAKLRETLEARMAQVRQRWIEEITAAVDADKVLHALRASSRAPDPGCRLPAELAVRLSRAAGSAMTPDTPADRWAALLEAAASSPVRRTVKPLGLPANAGEELMAAVRHASGRIPALAGLLGIGMPPPPAPARGTPPKPGAKVSQASTVQRPVQDYQPGLEPA
jgi:hypothetical protein